MNIKFSKKISSHADCIVIPVFQKDKTTDIPDMNLNKALADFVHHALGNAGNFKGASGATYTLPLAKEYGYKTAILLGLGDKSAMKPMALQDAGGKLFIALKAANISKPAVVLTSASGSDDMPASEMAAHMAAGFKLRAYSFETYKSKSKDESETNAKLEGLELCTDDTSAAEKSYKILDAMVSGVYTARDLVNEPPNVLYPEAYANRIKDLLTPLGVRVEILDEKQMLKKGMGAIMAVGQGSARQPRMVIMHWDGAAKSRKPLMLVGKGVTFDTGGISLKPGAGMEEMKMDMGGSAAVVGTLQALAMRKAKTNVVAVVGLAENMPSSNAFRPSDVITSYSGKTIEVLNTDAEGRLVLADCLTYGQEIAEKPEAIIDLATLTGAIMVALGHEYCGSFVNDNDFWSKLETSSAKTGEKLWRMPLDSVFKKDMEGTFGDLQNLGKSGRLGGACTAAGFLEHFIEEGTTWAHLDIAGTAWIKGDKPTVPKYATGFGVRLLNTLIADHYEG